MSLGRLAAWAGYEAALVDALPTGRQRGLAAIGVATPAAALIVGFGGRQWLLDAGASTPLALLGGVFAGLLAVATTRLLVAGGGVPAQAIAALLEEAARPNAPVDARTGATTVRLRYHPAWLAPLWTLLTAAIWTLPLAAHAAVELHVEPEAWPRGVGGWLHRAVETPTFVLWLALIAGLGALPAVLALLLRGARRDHAEARARRDHRMVLAAHARHRRQLAAALDALALPGFAGLAEEAHLDAPFALRRREAPWREAAPAEVAHVRWLLRH